MMISKYELKNLSTGKLIRKFIQVLDEKGWNQTEAASQTGIPQETIFRWKERVSSNSEIKRIKEDNKRKIIDFLRSGPSITVPDREERDKLKKVFAIVQDSKDYISKEIKILQDEYFKKVAEKLLQSSIIEEEPKVILDVGCGDSANASLACVEKFSGAKIIAIDWVEKTIEKAREKAAQLGIKNIDFRLVDANEIDANVQENVDLAIFNVFPLDLKENQMVLPKAVELLKSGGLALISYHAWTGYGEYYEALDKVLTDLNFLKYRSGYRPNMPENIPKLFRDGIGLKFKDVDKYKETKCFKNANEVWKFLETVIPIGLTDYGKLPSEPETIRNDVRDHIKKYLEEKFKTNKGIEITLAMTCIVAKKES